MASLAALENICDRDDSYLDKYIVWDPVRNDTINFKTNPHYVYVLGGKYLENTALKFIRDPGSYMVSHKNQKDMEFKMARPSYCSTTMPQQAG